MNALLSTLRFDQRPHRPCFMMAIFMGLGIFLGRLSFLSWMGWSMLAGVLIILSLMRTRASVILLHLSILSLGAFYYQSTYILPSDHIAFVSYQDQKNVQAIEGIVDSDVENKTTNYGAKQVFEVYLKKINIDGRWQATQGKILVNCFKPLEIRYGDLLKIQGSLFKAKNNPSEEFSYQQYLEDHNLFFLFSVGHQKQVDIVARNKGRWWIKFAIDLRAKCMNILSEYLEPQEAGMIQAMVLGERSYLTKDVYTLFSKTGTSHILAISGMNMAIIGAMVLFLLKLLRIPRSGQFILTAVFLILYCFVCGWSASVVRSVLMASVILSAFCLEFEAEAINSLGFAAIIIFLLNPQSLFDVGFQLSFICVYSIVCIGPLINPWIEEHIKIKLFKLVVQALGVSLIAWVSIIPLIAYQFGIVSMVSIIANIPIVPLADLVIVLSLGLIVMGLCCPLIALAFSGSLKVVFNFMLILISWFAQVPAAYFYVQDCSQILVISYYCLLILLIIIWSFKRKTRGALY